jgi:hypothetical protein
VSGILFGFSLLWSWLPLVGGMLLMGYLHVDDWLAGRGGLRRWKRPLLALAVPLVFLAIAVPSARVYQIPKVDCGYVLDRRLVEEMLQYRANRIGHRLPDRSRFGLADWWSLMDQLDDAENGEMVRDMPKDQRLAHLLKMYRGAYLEMRDGFNRGELPLWRLYRPHLLLYRNVREWSDQCDKPEQVEEGIAFVREMPRWRISPTEVLQRQYQYDYLFARYGVYFPDVMNALTGDNENVVTMYILMNRLPWERERTLRQLDRVFQQKSQLAWQAELAFWDDVGDAREVYQQSWAMHDQYSYLRDGGRSEGDYYQIDPIYALSRQSGYSMCSQAYSMEADRRATLLYLALRGYFLQHGEVPESLDDLKGSRLEEIPKVPGIGLDYYYQPHPRKIDLEAFEEEEYRERKRLENLPPLVRDGLPYLWYPESGTIHYDIPFPSPHIEEAEQDWRRVDDGELIPLHFAKFTLNVDSAGEETSEVGDAATGEEAK